MCLIEHAGDSGEEGTLRLPRLNPSLDDQDGSAASLGQIDLLRRVAIAQFILLAPPAIGSPDAGFPGPTGLDARAPVTQIPSGAFDVTINVVGDTLVVHQSTTEDNSRGRERRDLPARRYHRYRTR